MYSVLILTLNEALTIEGCIKSVRSDDVVVLDSGSTDDTVKIAEALGARVYSKKFESYEKQRNFGLNLEFKYEWILMLDADERIEKELALDLDARLKRLDSSITMISLLRKDYLFGTWLRGASGYPLHFPRIFKVGSTVVRRSINEVYETSGDHIKWKNHVEHYPFDKGIHWWFERHNAYSSMEVVALKSEKNTEKEKFISRRSKLKRIFYKLPIRPLIMFLYLFIFKLGFLAGRSGFHFSLMKAIYEYLILIKQKEMAYRNEHR